MATLVGYATEHGSTRGVAERIAERLREHRLEVDVRPMAEVADLARYSSVVLGSAIHGSKWLPEAKQFVDTNAGMLRERMVWLFSVSTVGDAESMYSPGVARRLRSMRGQTPEMTGILAAVAAREHRNFAGAVSQSQWPVPARAFFRAMGGRYGDHRNWAAIDAWADSVAEQVVLAMR